MNLEELEYNVFLKTKGNFVLVDDDVDGGFALIYNPSMINEKVYSGSSEEEVYKKLLKDIE